MLAEQQIVREICVDVNFGIIARATETTRLSMSETKTKTIEHEEIDFGGFFFERRPLRFENRVRRQSYAVFKNIFLGERAIIRSRTRSRVIILDLQATPSC